MEVKGEKLYTIRKDVKCLKCGNKGAIQHYGEYYPRGIGKEADKIKVLEKYREQPYMSHAMGFGGTIPHECLNCGNVGLIDFGGLEGYQQAFKTLSNEEYCVDLAKKILLTFQTREEKIYVRSFDSKAKKFQVFEDDDIKIQSAIGTKALSIEIKKPHHNPVIYLDDEGQFIRSHGECHYFLEHAKKILGLN